MHRGDAEGTLRPSEALAQLSHEHRKGLYMAWGSLYPTWARARLGQGGIGSTEVREALAAYAGQGNRLYVPFYQGLLAEIEGEEQKRGWSLGADRRSAGARRRDGRTLDRRVFAPHPR